MLAYHIICAPAEDRFPKPTGPKANTLPLSHGPPFCLLIIISKYLHKFSKWKQAELDNLHKVNLHSLVFKDIFRFTVHFCIRNYYQWIIYKRRQAYNGTTLCQESISILNLERTVAKVEKISDIVEHMHTFKEFIYCLYFQRITCCWKLLGPSETKLFQGGNKSKVWQMDGEMNNRQIIPMCHFALQIKKSRKYWNKSYSPCQRVVPP